MAQKVEKLENQWDMKSWTQGSGEGNGTVAVDGALIAHPDRSRVYFMSAASGPSVRFELDRNDIVEVVALPDPVLIADQKLSSARIVLKLSALVARTSLHEAAGLVEYPRGRISTVSGENLRLKNTVRAAVMMR